MTSEIPDTIEAQNDPEMDEFKAKLGPAGEIMTPQMLEHALIIATVNARKKIADPQKPADISEEDATADQSRLLK